MQALVWKFLQLFFLGPQIFEMFFGFTLKDRKIHTKMYIYIYRYIIVYYIYSAPFPVLSQTHSV